MNKNIKNFIKGFKEGRDMFGEFIGTVINSILLTIVYFLGVGVTWLFSKIFNKKFLEKDLDSNAKSYWQDLNLSKVKMEEYYKQH